MGWLIAFLLCGLILDVVIKTISASAPSSKDDPLPPNFWADGNKRTIQKG